MYDFNPSNYTRHFLFTYQSFSLCLFIALTVSGKSVSVPTGQAGLAAIDTGTTLIGGPTSAVNDLFSQIPGSMNLSQIDPSLAGMFSIRTSLRLNLYPSTKLPTDLFLHLSSLFYLTLYIQLAPPHPHSPSPSAAKTHGRSA